MMPRPKGLADARRFTAESLRLLRTLNQYPVVQYKLLAKLSRCAWKVLSAYLKQSVYFDDAVPGAAIAVHTFGDFQQFNPHFWTWRGAPFIFDS